MLRSSILALISAVGLSAAPVPHVLAINVDGMISPITVEIVGHALDQAAAANDAAVLLRLNTPGGLMDASREINEKIVASRVPVIAYVTPSGGRAASAGFFLLEAADVAAMAPGTNTGASSPVLLTGEMDETMRKKVENDASAWLRSLVAKRGHNAALAEKTIREAKAFTEKESLDDHLIDIVSPDEAQLLAALDGRQITRFDGRKEILHTAGAVIDEYQPSARERIVNAVADPNIGFLLLIIGALGVYVEFTSPGLILPGVAGGILFLLGLSSLAVMPINWIGTALLLLGATLLILEVKFASHGVLGVGGTVSMVLGALLLVNGPPEVRIHLATALAVVLPFAAITLFLVTLAVRARRNKATMSDGGMVNQLGQARTALAPAGTVFVHGEYWDAVSSSPVESGAEVRVVAIDGLKLRVEPANPRTDANSKRSLRSPTFRRCPESGLRPGLRRVARGREDRPLDVVHLPAASRAGPQFHGGQVWNLLATRSPSVFEASRTWTASGRVHPAGESYRGPHHRRDFRRHRHPEVPVLDDPVCRRRIGESNLPGSAAQIFRINGSRATFISRRLRALALSREGIPTTRLLLCGQKSSAPSSVRTT